LLDTTADFILLITSYFPCRYLLFKSSKAEVGFIFIRNEEQVDKRQESMQKQTSPRTENPAIAGFLLGDYRTKLAVHQISVNFLVAVGFHPKGATRFRPNEAALKC